MINMTLSALALIVAYDPQTIMVDGAVSAHVTTVDPIARSVPAPVARPIVKTVQASTPPKRAEIIAPPPARPDIKPTIAPEPQPVQRPIEPQTQTVQAEQMVNPPVQLAQVETEPVEQAPLESQTPAPVDPNIAAAEWPAIIARVDQSLKDAKTAQGRFRQSSSSGSIEGSFAISRPGKMRFDYDDPSPLLVVADGTTVALADLELETVDRVPLRSTPLGFVLSSSFQVDDAVTVQRIMRNQGRLAITLEDASGDLDGEVTLLFNEADMNLLGWLAVDSQQHLTAVDLLKVDLNKRVDPRLFRLDEADDEDDER